MEDKKMDTYTYYSKILDDSGFECESNITGKDFTLIHQTATDQLVDLFPPSRWADIDPNLSFSVRSIPFRFYERWGIIAWCRFNDVYSEGSLYDVDVIWHEKGRFQVGILELDADIENAVGYAYTSDAPMFHILESLGTGFETEFRKMLIDKEIEEMTR